MQTTININKQEQQMPMSDKLRDKLNFYMNAKKISLADLAEELNLTEFILEKLINPKINMCYYTSTFTRINDYVGKQVKKLGLIKNT